MRVTNAIVGMFLALAFPIKSWAATYLHCQAADKEGVSYIFSFGGNEKVFLKSEICISSGRCIDTGWRDLKVINDSEVEFSGRSQESGFLFEGNNYFNISKYTIDKVTGLLKVNVGIFEDNDGSKFAPVSTRKRMQEEGGSPTAHREAETAKAHRG